MKGLRRGAREAWERGEDQMRRQWAIWVLGLAFYALVGFTLMTRASIASPLHLIVFVMAAAVLSVTSLRIEWGVLALAIILPFARPGITVGNPKILHVSGFNFALVGVVLAYVLRYAADAQFAKLGPMVRRTRLDRSLMTFGFLFLISCLWSFNFNQTSRLQLMTLGFLKEHVLYFIWFYLIIAMLRTPQDLRRFSMFFAVAGLLASFVGMATRLMGGAAAITPGTSGEDIAEGAGGRVGGGWLGLDHPNMFAALLIMTMPMWFFAINHLKHGFRRLMAEVAVVNGFMGLMFTYSRSAWLGSLLGIGLVGLYDRKSLGRIFLFGAIFAIAAQTVVLFTINMNLIEVILLRFQQLETSTFSARPYIYASALEVIKAHPLLGVGAGTFRAHAPSIPLGWVPSHSHNVYLAYAAEAGIPTALAFAWITIRAFVMSISNLRRIARVPGYGFIALGSCAALISLTAQSMAVQIFHHRMLGFGYYTLLAIIVSLDRMVREGRFDDMKPAADDEGRGSSIWLESERE